MRKLKMPFFLFLSLIALQFTLLAAEPSFITTESAVDINEVYIPNDLDSETESYVIVAGAYPNGCYRWKGSELINLDLYNHIIRPVAYVSQSYCIMVLVPFIHRVRLGKLAPGSHNLLFLKADGRFIRRTLEIK